MKSPCESDPWTAGSHSLPSFRSEAEAAWMRDAMSKSADHPYHASSLMEERKRRIREAAYFKAERRGFPPGHALDDWLEAEQDVDAASRPLPRW
jgi:hypothetical protein